MSSVSVIVPCYNYAHYLESCVRSILDQPGVDVEVMIIDDESPDDTPAVASALAQDSRVTYVRHEQNRGHIATYNEGLEWASGDYSLLLSADDMLVPGALKRAADALDANPTAGLVYGRSLFFVSNDDLPEARTGVPRVDRWDGTTWIAKRCAHGTGCISSPEAVVRTKVQHQVGGYKAELGATGDMEMWLRFAAVGDVIFLAGVDQAYYRRHQQSMARTTYAAPLVDLQQHIVAFDVFFDEYGDVVPGADAMRAHVHEVLARKALYIASRAYDRRRLDVIPVDELEAFAFAAYPDAARLREHRMLQRRRRMGERVAPLFSPFAVSAYEHWVRDKLWWRQYVRKGV